MEDVMSKYRVGLQRFADFRKTVKSLVRLEMAVTSVYAIFLLWQSGPYYFEIRAGEASFKAGDYSNAEQHLLSAVRLSNRLADGDVRRIRAVNNLAELYRATRRFTDAENYSLVALAHAQQYLVGKAEYISCINNLAVIRRDEGDYVSSQALFEQVLIPLLLVPGILLLPLITIISPKYFFHLVTFPTPRSTFFARLPLE